MKMKRFMSLFIILMITFNTITLHAIDHHEEFLEEANTLKELGLFEGSDIGFELNRYGTRVEAAVIIVRLLGVEEEALSLNYQHPFLDVPKWADSYIGYLYHENLTSGVSDHDYGSGINLTPNQFMTFVIRSLDYDDSKGDFEWTKALDKALELSIINEEYKEYLNQDDNIYRDDMVAIMYNMLNVKMNDPNQSLIDFLINKGVTTLIKAKELDVYKQVESLTITGEIIAINDSHKGLITDTINHYNYYVIVPFGVHETPYTGLVYIQSENTIYECVISKEAYFTNENYQFWSLGDTITLNGEYATNMIENSKNTSYILVKE